MDSQNVFFDVRGSTFNEMTEMAVSDPVATQWVDLFLSLGDKLGIVVEPEKGGCERDPGQGSHHWSTADRRASCPKRTYRLQLNSGFTFEAACKLVPYLHDLGVSDATLAYPPGRRAAFTVTTSATTRGSGRSGWGAALLDLAAALESRAMGLVFDVVPNHMAVGNVANHWWEDVLEHGPSSRYADFFDIDWRPTNPDLEAKVLLPILSDQYGRTLEAGHLRLSYGGGSFAITYYDTKLPVAPRTYMTILSSQITELTRRLGDDHEHLLDIAAFGRLNHLPTRTRLREEGQTGVTARSRSSGRLAYPGRRRGFIRHRGFVDRFNGRLRISTASIRSTA
jgi:hypothetical protein